MPWPGNVRELRSFLCPCRLEGGGPIDAGRLRRLLAEPDPTALFPCNLLAQESLPALQRRPERDYLLHHARRLRGDPAALCDFLGLRRQQLYRLLQRTRISLREVQRGDGER